MPKSIKHKKAKSGKRIKAPSPVASDEPDKQPPIFCLQYLVRGFCVSDCNTEQKAAFADALRKLGQLSWRELRQVDRHKLGYEIIRTETIQAPIPAHITDDVTFIAFRFYGMLSVLI